MISNTYINMFRVRFDYFENVEVEGLMLQMQLLLANDQEYYAHVSGTTTIGNLAMLRVR